MAAELITVVKEIAYKVRKLKHEYDLEVIKNEEYKEKIIKLESQIQQQQQEINTLIEKTKLIKLSKTISNKRDLTQTKLKINELVREIDTCINLLNK